MSDRPLAEASTCNNTQDTNIHANDGIRIRNISERPQAYTSERAAALKHTNMQNNNELAKADSIFPDSI
jgi:hypothetical protein